MRILTVIGTRPEIIRLSRIIPRLDAHSEHILVHTGQNSEKQLSDVFFQELRLRPPDMHLGVEAVDFAEQLSQILLGVDRAIADARPDRVVILGDTNSGLAALVAARRGVPVYHLEAGNRCYDNRVPEEVNRRIIDHCSAVLMPYTRRSKENLVREGIEADRIFVVGNPIFEVLLAYETQIASSDALRRLGLSPRDFFLATLHRAENVDSPDRLTQLVYGLDAVATRFEIPVVVSLHPRTADKMRRLNVTPRSDKVRLLEPLGFFDFVALERQAKCVLTDSGTVQEECAILGVPNVTVRDVTERPETIECGSNILSGPTESSILAAVEVALEGGTGWVAPAEYLERQVSLQVAKVVLGYRTRMPWQQA